MPLAPFEVSIHVNRECYLFQTRRSILALAVKKLSKGDLTMSDEFTEVKVGQLVPDFELTVYEPENHGFGTRKLADLKKAGKWTILFFYPADFTFV
jgi:hypothetical protein